MAAIVANLPLGKADGFDTKDIFTIKKSNELRHRMNEFKYEQQEKQQKVVRPLEKFTSAQSTATNVTAALQPEDLTLLCRICRYIREENVCLKNFQWQLEVNAKPNLNVLTPVGFVDVIKKELPKLDFTPSELGQLCNQYADANTIGRIDLTRFIGDVRRILAKPIEQKISPEWYKIGPYEVRTLSDQSEARLVKLMDIICEAIDSRHLRLPYYFKDYEEKLRNSQGAVDPHFTYEDFIDMFKYYNIIMRPEDYEILCRKFTAPGVFRDINYKAFLYIVQLEKEKRRCQKYGLDPGILSLVAEDQISAAQDLNYGETYVNRRPPPPIPTVEETIEKIRDAVFERGLRLRDRFIDFDGMRSGRMTRTQFRRMLDTLCIGGLSAFELDEQEIQQLITHFQYNADPKFVCWEPFVEAVDVVFGDRWRIQAIPTLRDEDYALNRRERVQPAADATKNIRINVDEAEREDQPTLPHEERLAHYMMQRLRLQIDQNKIQLYPYFRDFDQHRRIHVTPTQFLQVLSMAGLELEGQWEVEPILRKYIDGYGFHFMKFLNDLDPKEFGPKLSMFKERVNFIKNHHDWQEGQAEQRNYPLPQHDCDVWTILRIIRARCDVTGVRVRDWFKDLDWYTGKTTRERFRRCVDMSGVRLSEWQCALLEDRYKNEKEPLTDMVEWIRFVEDIENPPEMNDAFGNVGKSAIQSIGPRAAEVKLQQESTDLEILQKALEKLSYVMYKQNFEPLTYFEDFDYMNHGTCTRSQFRRVLSFFGVDVLNEDEYQSLFRVYGKMESDEATVDYMRFCRRLRDMTWRARYLPKPTEPNQSAMKLRPADCEREYLQFLSTGGQDVISREDAQQPLQARPNVIFRTAD